jgi:aminopeptidase YwaD
MRRLAFFLIPLCLLLLLVPAAAQATPTFSQAIDKLFAQNYPQGVDSYLCSLGTNPVLGFRWAGTTADNAGANYIADQMRAMGLKNVRLEPVPVDVFNYKSSTVTVGSKTMIASAFAGVRPTPFGGVRGQVVYVHDGTAADYQGLDVKGKLVLVDSAMDYFWLNLQGAEATFQGAKGVIMTHGPDSTSWYSVAADALGSNDAEYDMSFVPMVYVSWQDGDWLKAQLAAGPVTATMTLDETVKLASDGGVGYNVLGELPGTVKDGTFVLYAAHHDAHFRNSIDDTGAVANVLSIAKAMTMSGYKPKHTIVFMFTTAEEYGYTNAWYDWSSGAWWAITHTHPDWVGRIRTFMNLESMATPGQLSMGTSEDLQPWLDAAAKASGALLPHGYAVTVPASTWQDCWTFTAAGVPSVVFGTGGAPYGSYHTPYVDFSRNVIEWPYMADIAKFIYGLQNRVDDGLLPYGLKSRADAVAATVVPGKLTRAGADPVAVSRLGTAVNAYRTAANTYEARKDFIAPAAIPLANQTLLKIEKLLNGNFTALNAWDYTCYPQQQVLWDVEYLNTAISALDQSQPKPATALTALSNVALTFYGLTFSHDVYLYDLTRRDPNYYRVTWGAQGHLIHYLDVVPQYRAIEAGTWGPDTVSQLKAMRALDISDLNSRLNAMSNVLEQATPLLQSVK